MSVIVEGVRKIRICANELCMIAFDPSRHNQKYCSKNCCKVVTNSKIMAQYYEEKDRRSGKPRTCKKCKTSRLSRYNQTTTCAPCVAAEEAASRATLLRALGMQ